MGGTARRDATGNDERDRRYHPAARPVHLAPRMAHVGHESSQSSSRHCGRRNRRTSVSRDCRGPRMARALSGCRYFVCRHVPRHRGAGDPARGICARFHPQRRPEGQVAHRPRARRLAGAARPGRRLAADFGAPARPGSRGRRLQFGARCSRGGAARHPDDAARAERGAGSDQPAACASGAAGGRNVCLDGPVLRTESIRQRQPGAPGVPVGRRTATGTW